MNCLLHYARVARFARLLLAKLRKINIKGHKD
jgi:hypothetical protein